MLRVGIIGLGGIGKLHARHYLAIPEARVEAIADVRSQALQTDSTLQSLFEVPLNEVRWFENYAALVADGKLDMVDICLPTSVHRPATIAALEAGLHVLCEKPMANTPADCDAMLEAQHRAQRLLMIAQCIRFWPEYEYLTDLYRSGAAGRLLSLQLWREGRTPQGVGGWMRQARESGGAILDLHIHDIDFCQSLLGLPRRVYAQGGQSAGAEQGYDYVLSNLAYGDGQQVSATAQWMDLPVPFFARYEARFESAFLHFNSRDKPTLTVYRAEASEPEHPSLGLTTAHENEIRYFVRCVLENSQPTRCMPEEARHSVALVHHIMHSIEQDELVRVP
jgi:predicted dehydrogenase